MRALRIIFAQNRCALLREMLALFSRIVLTQNRYALLREMLALFSRIVLTQNRYALLREMLYQPQKASVTHCAGKTEDC